MGNLAEWMQGIHKLVFIFKITRQTLKRGKSTFPVIYKNNNIKNIKNKHQIYRDKYNKEKAKPE